MALSWIDELCLIYDKNKDLVGYEETTNAILLPIYHSTANAQIEVSIDIHGNFIGGSIIDKDDNITIIPVSMDSASRSSGITPHPLCDKFLYVAGDYENYIPKTKKNVLKYYDDYMAQLKMWVDSPYVKPPIKAIYDYLSKKSLIGDLVNIGILKCDENNILLPTPKIGTVGQLDSFVRFRVEDDSNIIETRVWQNKELFQSFIDYNNSCYTKKNLCYITGKSLTCTEKHASKIRNTGDKAKLISANDESGFTYRGRFANKEQVMSVGYEVSEKAHNALKWLISRQGWHHDSLNIVSWANNMAPIPSVVGDTVDIWSINDYEDEDEDAVRYPQTGSAFAKQLNLAISGYASNLTTASKVIVMTLDAATKGRLSITLYRELNGSQFLENLQKWHLDMAWHLSKVFNKEKKYLVMAPSPKKIAQAIYGTEQNGIIKAKDDIINSTIDRLLPCIIDGRKIPKDLINRAVINGSNPQAYEKKYNWQEVLGIACSLVKKEMIENKEDITMALDKSCTDRSYLFGRLLAVADIIESSTFEKDEKRQTNAKRYMSAFSSNPFKTWKMIEERLQPYLNKMVKGSQDLSKTGKRSQEYYTEILNEICDKFTIDDFASDDKLNGKYLLGFHCQTSDLFNNKGEN
ncbi:MAG: type I-C CRISPR-associated protein Cas8c/Csd1 [Clostridiales bacterium]